MPINRIGLKDLKIFCNMKYEKRGTKACVGRIKDMSMMKYISR